MQYQQNYLAWKKDPEKFWENCASGISWFKKWKSVLKKERLRFLEKLINFN